MNIDYLIKTTEISVKKNGADKPLTIGHFLNILKLADQWEMNECMKTEDFLKQLFNEHLDPNS